MEIQAGDKLRIRAIVGDKAVGLFYEYRMQREVSQAWAGRCRTQILAALAALSLVCIVFRYRIVNVYIRLTPRAFHRVNHCQSPFLVLSRPALGTAMTSSQIQYLLQAVGLPA